MLFPMSETFKKSQMSEFFYVSAGCATRSVFVVERKDSKQMSDSTKSIMVSRCSLAYLAARRESFQWFLLPFCLKIIGGYNGGGRDTRSQSNFFHFHAFSGKNLVKQYMFSHLLGSSISRLWERLDSPLPMNDILSVCECSLSS